MLIKSYALLCASTTSMAQTASLVRNLIDVSFIEHQSSFLGEYLLAGDIGDEHIVIYVNYRDDDGDLAETDCAEGAVVIEVNATQRWSELKRALLSEPGLVVVRVEEL